jgi:hypothetical protein
VFRSSLHSARKAIPWWTLQRPDYTGLEETTLRQYAELYDAYFEERSLIPAGRLHELSYEALIADPLGQLRAVYEALQLPDFTVAEPAVRDYLATIRDYERNRFADLASPWKEAVTSRCRRAFDEWGYPA